MKTAIIQKEDIFDEQKIDLCRIGTKRKKLKKEAGECKRTETALRESEEKYRNIVENVNVGILVVQEMRLVFANAAISELLGYSRDEIISNPNPFIFIHPDDTEKVIERHMARVKGEAVADTYPFRVVTKDGSIIWTEVTAIRIDWMGSPAVLSFFTDITERKRIEEALLESEKKYRLLVNNLPSIVYKGFKDFTVEFFDNKVELLIGYTVDEFNSKRMKWSDIIVKEDIETAKRCFIQSLKTDKSYVREYKIRTKSGDIIWIQERGQIVCNSKGEIEYVSGVFFDITVLKKAEKALQKSNERMESILFSLPTGIMIIDTETQKIVDTNPQAILMTGAPLEQIVGSQCNKFIFFKDENKSFIADVERVPKDSECVLLTLNSEKIPIHTSIIPVTLDDRECLILGFVDISEHKRAEQERIKKEKLQGVIEMAGAVCHELNQPLQAVSGYSELLMMEIKAGNPFYDKIHKIKEQVERMGTITKKLMRITRYETLDYLEGKIIDLDKAAG